MPHFLPSLFLWYKKASTHGAQLYVIADSTI
jgi:hypothetical protein